MRLVYLLIIWLVTSNVYAEMVATNLYSKDGLIYQLNHESPYTGTYLSKYTNGQNKIKANIKNGSVNGHYIWWYENGQKKEEGNFKNGQKEGLTILWYKNGKKNIEEYYKGGKLVAVEKTFY